MVAHRLGSCPHRFEHLALRVVVGVRRAPLAHRTQFEFGLLQLRSEQPQLLPDVRAGRPAQPGDPLAEPVARRQLLGGDVAFGRDVRRERLELVEVGHGRGQIVEHLGRGPGLLRAPRPLAEGERRPEPRRVDAERGPAGEPLEAGEVLDLAEEPVHRLRLGARPARGGTDERAHQRLRVVLERHQPAGDLEQRAVRARCVGVELPEQVEREQGAFRVLRERPRRLAGALDTGAVRVDVVHDLQDLVVDHRLHLARREVLEVAAGFDRELLAPHQLGRRQLAAVHPLRLHAADDDVEVRHVAVGLDTVAQRRVHRQLVLAHELAASRVTRIQLVDAGGERVECRHAVAVEAVAGPHPGVGTRGVGVVAASFGLGARVAIECLGRRRELALGVRELGEQLQPVVVGGGPCQLVRDEPLALGVVHVEHRGRQRVRLDRFGMVEAPRVRGLDTAVLGGEPDAGHRTWIGWPW